METRRPRWVRYLCLEGGFSIIAFSGEAPVGLISVKWQDLPPPLPLTREGYINIIEVTEKCRRKGIGRKLVELALAKAKTERVVQVRAWSTNDKLEAIPMWKALGFTLCPVTHSMWKNTEVTGYFVAKRLDDVK